MSAKFASITASLLARKGDAVPSSMTKPPLAWQTPIPHLGTVVPPPYADAHPVENFAQHGDYHAPHDEHHYLRKIQIGLSDADHEKLRIVAARLEKSRQQIVRDALAHYYEKLGHEYGNRCACLSKAGPCSRNCNG